MSTGQFYSDKVQQLTVICSSVIGILLLDMLPSINKSFHFGTVQSKVNEAVVAVWVLVDRSPSAVFVVYCDCYIGVAVVLCTDLAF